MLLQFLLQFVMIGCCWFPCCKPAKPCHTPTVTHCVPCVPSCCGTTGTLYPHPYPVVVHPVVVTPVQKDMPKTDPKKEAPKTEPKKEAPKTEPKAEPKKPEEPKKVDPKPGK